MNVCIASYPSIALLRGGPLTQILGTKLSLEELGATVRLYDPWKGFGDEKPDLVHLFGAHVGTYHLAREIRKAGIPLVVTPIFFSNHPIPLLKTTVAMAGLLHKIVKGSWTDYGFLREICGWADVVVPNTTEEARLLRRCFGVPDTRISVVPNGVSSRFGSADPEIFTKKYGVGKFVLNTGHVGPGRKNVLNLIKALERINVSSVIIGRIEKNDYARECLKEAKNNPRLLVLDELPNDSDLLASAYAACDVFVLPSLFETPGIAALEAACAGAKIVITRHGGTKEVFGGEAEYVEPSSVELIHHGITTALNKPRSTVLRDRILAAYTWPQIGKQSVTPNSIWPPTAPSGTWSWTSERRTGGRRGNAGAGSPPTSPRMR
jgi:glycosyltransferase involved in cell wall biosynthesis